MAKKSKRRSRIVTPRRPNPVTIELVPNLKVGPHGHPFPAVEYPFVIIDADGKLWRIDPQKGTYRALAMDATPPVVYK